ncbi:MAG: TRAP transporter small permease [Cytophagales bacterium]|nr:TRAP transporter small permease [Bernardetiaceae bacterium]MDW8204693.1 TRAP transporter small permease [Cytophagales bacterium]
MKALKQLLDQAHVFAMNTLFVSLVVIIFVQILMRYVFKNPLVVTEELSRFVLIYLCMIGASYVSGRRAHLSIEILKNHHHFARYSALITEVIKFVFITLVMVAGGYYLNRNVYWLNQTSAVLRIPLFYVYLIIPVCGVLMLIYCTINIIAVVRNEKI